MYTLIGARFRRDRRAGRWEEGALADVPVRSLQPLYGDVWLFLEHPAWDGPRALRFDTVVEQTYTLSPTLTVADWLQGLGNQTLPVTDALPTFQPRYVQYAHAWMADYEITPVHRTGALTQGGSLAAKTDLHIRRADVDPQHLGQHALISVNGLFHLSDYGPDGVVVHDAHTSVRRANSHHIGIHSFAQIGKITQIPITPAMLSRQHEGLLYRQGVYVTVPESVELQGKTVLLVLGGYLQAFGKTYTQVGDRTFRIELGSLLLVERYYDSYRDLDLSCLGLTAYDEQGHLLSVAEIQSDAVIEAYLTLSQSFLVVVDTPVMFQELEPLEPTRLPGRYLNGEHRQLPLIGALGRGLEYHVLPDEGKYVYATTSNHHHRYEFYRRNWRQGSALVPSRETHDPFDQAQAYFRLLGVET